MTLHCTLLFSLKFLYVVRFSLSRSKYSVLVPVPAFSRFSRSSKCSVPVYYQDRRLDMSKLSGMVTKISNTCMSDSIHAFSKGGSVSISIEGDI